MSYRVLKATLACVALLNLADALGVPKDKKLSVHASDRNLQILLPDLECQAQDYNPGRKRTHLLANLDKDGKVLERWVPQDESIQLFVDRNEGSARLIGNLVPKGKEDENNVLTIDFEFSNAVPYTSCYCASEEFAGSLLNPKYNRIQNSCTLKNYLARSEEARDLLFCPTCEENECRMASRNPVAPEPVYQNWFFFTEVSGSLSGPGLELFRQNVVKGFKSYNLDPDAGCTPDITNLPLPQLGCSGFEEFSPTDDLGFGFGVNGKNQKCGMSSWFNCREDVEALGGDEINVHVADINLNIIRCAEPDFNCPPVLTPEFCCDNLIITNPEDWTPAQLLEYEQECRFQSECQQGLIPERVCP